VAANAGDSCFIGLTAARRYIEFTAAQSKMLSSSCYIRTYNRLLKVPKQEHIQTTYDTGITSKPYVSGICTIIHVIVFHSMHENIVCPTKI